MNNFISIFSQNEPDNVKIKIRLGNEFETFDLITADWSLQKYLRQWKHAALFALQTRETVGLIKSYECSKQHVKVMGIYTVIPIEIAYPNRLQTSNEQEGFYITESFIFVSERIASLISDDCFNEIYKNYGNYFPIYHFDEKNMNRFYLYLSTKVEGISSWKITCDDLRSVLKLNS
jgi:hypothetical protein